MADEIRLGFKAESADAVVLRERLEAVKGTGVELAESLARGEITLEAYASAAKALGAELAPLEKAYRTLKAAEDAANDRADDASRTAALAAEAAAAEKAAAKELELAHAQDLVAMQAEHEVAMLEHEEQQLRELAAAEDREIDATMRSVAADNKAADALDREAAAFGRVTAQEEHEVAALDRDIAKQKDLQAALDRTTTGLDKVSKAAKKSSQGVAGFGQTGLQAGRVVQDFAQGGIAGVLNNIEGMTQALGLGSGLAGVLTILGVAAFVAMPHLKSLWEAISNPDGVKSATDAIEALKDRIKELEESKGKLSIDVHELDVAREKLKALTAAQAAWDAAQHKQTLAESEAGKKISEALTESEGGEEAVSGDVKTDILREFKDPAKNLKIKEADAAVAAAEKRKADAERAIARPSMSPGEAQGKASELAEAEKEILAARKRRMDAETKAVGGAEREYGRLRQLATEGHGIEQQAAQEELTRRIAQTGRAGLANEVGIATPRAMKEKRQAKEAADNDEAAKKAADAEQKRAEAAQKKADKEEDDELNRQGHQNEGPALRELTAAKKAAKKQLHDEIDAGAKEMAAEEKAVGAEAKHVERSVGPQKILQYEAAKNANQGAIDRGAPIVRSDAQEAAAKKSGRDYALPPEVLEQRQERQMATEFQRRGASPAGAKQAAKSIAEKGDEDLSRRAADAAGQGLNLTQQSVAIQGQLVAAYQGMSGTMRQIQAELGRQARGMNATSRNGRGNR